MSEQVQSVINVCECCASFMVHGIEICWHEEWHNHQRIMRWGERVIESHERDIQDVFARCDSCDRDIWDGEIIFKMAE